MFTFEAFDRHNVDGGAPATRIAMRCRYCPKTARGPMSRIILPRMRPGITDLDQPGRLFLPLLLPQMVHRRDDLEDLLHATTAA